MSAPLTGRIATGTLGIVVAVVLSGCATASLDRARNEFYRGQFDTASQTLANEQPASKDRVLFLMERGTMRQANGDYEGSSHDFIESFDDLDRMAAVSVSKDTASMVVNDSVQNYRGAPYERTLLHAFTAKNHLAEGNWENAAVEARRIIYSLAPESKGDYPDDAYSRYMAGFCLEMIDDFSNASLQYRKAGELVSDVTIDDKTGKLSPKIRTTSTNSADTVVDAPADNTLPCELVCFVMIGRAPYGSTDLYDTGRFGQPMYAELYGRGKYLGRSYNLADTVDMAFTTEQKEAARKIVKTVGRVAIKEGIANEVGHNNEALGELTRFLLIGLLEQPDVRRWETLPRWLEVARVPCPADLSEYEVVIKSASGTTVRSIRVEKPIARHGNTYVSFCRDIVPVP